MFPSSDIPAGRFLIFISLWSLLVYNPVARWTWHWAGWSNQRHVMDFAGGTAVHITSGTTVLAFYIFYALQTKRKPFQRKKRGSTSNDAASSSLPTTGGILAENGDAHSSRSNSIIGSDDSQHNVSHVASVPKNNVHGHDLEPGTQNIRRTPSFPVADMAPHNVNNIVLGTALLWIGWFGFNGGSALGGNLRAVSACVSTHVAACAGGTTMLLLNWGWNYAARLANGDDEEVRALNLSVTHFCDGAVVALVAITPGAGFVSVICAPMSGYNRPLTWR